MITLCTSVKLLKSLNGFTLGKKKGFVRLPSYFLESVLLFRFQLKDELDEGRYDLKFLAKRGQMENQIVAVDDIELKTILITKTDDEMPTTTTTTTAAPTTITTEIPTSSDAPTTPPTPTLPPTSSTVAPVPLKGGMIGYSGEVMIIFLIVALATALALLSVKHHQMREKLREYEVAKNANQQNYDNPLFTGQHTSAERYGTIAGP